LDIRFHNPSISNPDVENSLIQQTKPHHDHNFLNFTPEIERRTELDRGVLSTWDPQFSLPDTGHPVVDVNTASRSERVQSKDLLDSAAFNELEDSRLSNTETQRDFLDDLWNMCDEPSTHMDHSSFLFGMSNFSPGPPAIFHDLNTYSPTKSNWEIFSHSSPDPIDKFVWLSHYSTAYGLSSKFNFTDVILDHRQIEGRDAVSSSCNANEGFSGAQYENRGFTELDDVHSSRRERVGNVEFDIPSQDTFTHFQWYSDPLALKTNEVVGRVKEAVQRKPRNSIITFDWSPLLEGMCVSFFSPPNIRRLLEVFWSEWHPHWPVIHKPTFDPSNTPVTLLASMMLIGCCTSTDISDHNNAKIWANSVEEMAFSDECFCGNIIVVAQQSHTARKRLQSLQAAHAICIYQYYEGDDVSKRRVRTYRYSAEVIVS
jgi:hypothetical protein